MKIIQVASGMETRMGGPPRVIAGVANALVRDRVSVQLLTTHASSPSDEPTVPIDCPVESFVRCRPRRWYAAQGMARGFSDKAWDADIIHLHEVWGYPQYAGARFAARERIPHVLTPHGELGPRHMRYKGWFHYLKKRAYLRTIGRRVLRNAACVHVLSTAEEQSLQEAGYRGPVAVVPNGVNLMEFAKLPPREAADDRWPCLAGRRVVLFLSRLSPEKGLSRLIPAWGEIARHDSFSDTVLVLAGPSDRGYGSVVERLVDEHGVQDRVLLPGMVNGDDRLRLLSRADVYTLPSFGEGFSMAVLENLAAGTPVLITPACNFPEVDAFGAGLCVPPDVESLKSALSQLLDLTDAERSAMGQRGRQLVREGYTWENVARKMLTVYRCILQGREVPRHPKPAPPPTAPAIVPRRAA